jgi:hypothetical protein
MYRKQQREQVEFEDFHLAFGGKLRSDNRWVRLAKLIPWDKIEERYAELFSETHGAPAISAREAVASLVIKEKLGLSDEETVEQIRENAYLQYLLGWEAFRDEPPFDPSMMVHFRKRLNDSVLAEINELIIQQARRSSEEDEEGGGTRQGEGNAGSEQEQAEASEGEQEPPNCGSLLMDASCTPADIRYPTDLSLLNEAREKTEEIIDVLHRPDVGRKVKPRTYRRKARKDYLGVAKKRRPSAKRVRKAIGKQLRYIGRNLNTINELAPGRLVLLKPRQYRNLLVCGEVYRQQKQMYDSGTRSISGRIVSISQPHVRPIVRGKAASPVEFGAKISLSKVEQFVYLDRVSWEPYHESEDLPHVVETFRRRHGHYPRSVHVDAIYRTRANRRYCKERGIRISGPPLGRPKKHPSAEETRQTLRDERARIPIEGALGQAKRAFSLSRVMAKRADTAVTSIAMVVLVMNLETLLRVTFFALYVARLLLPVWPVPSRYQPPLRLLSAA